MQRAKRDNADNITGQVRLTRYRSSSRGIPQIEVTFDIDANGIVNVSAKDLGTGKTSRSRSRLQLSFLRMRLTWQIKEAEQYAEEDKKKKEEVEVRTRLKEMLPGKPKADE